MSFIVETLSLERENPIRWGEKNMLFSSIIAAGTNL